MLMVSLFLCGGSVGGVNNTFLNQLVDFLAVVQ